MSFSWHISFLGFSINTKRLTSDNAQERKIRFKIDPFTKCQTHTVNKTHPSSIFTRFNTRYVIPLFSYTDTLFEWSQMEIIKLEFLIFWLKHFFMFITSLLLLNFCLCVYLPHYWAANTFHLSLKTVIPSSMTKRRIVNHCQNCITGKSSVVSNKNDWISIISWK